MQETVGIYNHEKQWAVFVELASRDIRYALCYYMAIETGLRISDILALKRPVKKSFTITESKTGKERVIGLSDDLMQMFQVYDGLVPYTGLVFPFSRSTFWRHMKSATRACGLKQRIGVHGLRKTYA